MTNLKTLARATALAALLSAPAFADSPLDPSGTGVLDRVVDYSRASNPAMQCTLTVTSAATALATLMATASCAALPACPAACAQALYLQPTGGAIWYRTDGTAPVANPVAGTSSAVEVFQNGGWWIEGRLAIAGLQLIAASSVSVNIEVRY